MSLKRPVRIAIMPKEKKNQMVAWSEVTPVEMAKKQKSRWDYLTGLAGTKKTPCK